MSEKDLEIQRKSITALILGQLKIFKLNGKCKQEVTISLPKVRNVNKTLVKEIFTDILGYTPEIKDYKEIKSSKSSTMLITVVLKND